MLLHQHCQWIELNTNTQSESAFENKVENFSVRFFCKAFFCEALMLLQQKTSKRTKLGDKFSGDQNLINYKCKTLLQ